MTTDTAIETVLDYYQLLEFDQTLSLDEIRKHIGKKRNDARKKAQGAQDSSVRRKFEDIQNWANQAGVEFKDEASRQDYDQRLEAQRQREQQERELQQARFGSRNYYQLLGLPNFIADTEQIERHLKQYEQEIATGGEKQANLEKRKELLQEAREMLLDPEKRKEYDQILQAFLSDKKNLPKIPLNINGIDVEYWHELEPVLSRELHEGLLLLLDGEIESWVRWSLVQPHRANVIQSISQLALKDNLPLMGYQELLLYINPERPFTLQAGGKPVQNPLTIRAVKEIPPLADQNWQLFITCFNYVIRWIDNYSDDSQEGTVMSTYESLQPKRSVNVQLERLLYSIDRKLPTPQATVSGISNNTIDFGMMRRWDKPHQILTVSKSGRGYFYGRVKTSANWLVVTPAEFEGDSTQFDVTIDRQKIPSGAQTNGEITIELMDGRMMPIAIQLLAHQATFFQSLMPGKLGGKPALTDGSATSQPASAGGNAWLWWGFFFFVAVLILIAMSN